MSEPFGLDLDTLLDRKHLVAERVDPTKTAAIMVDLQEDWLTPGFEEYLTGGNGAPSGETVAENAVKALALYRQYGIPVFWMRWALRSDGWDAGLWEAKWPFWHIGDPKKGPHWENPHGDIHPALKPASGEPIIDKSYYSSFFRTPLDTFLQHIPHVDTLVIIGISTNFCLRYTVQDAFARDYKVVVLADCTTGINSPVNGEPGSGQYLATLVDIQMGLGDVLTVAELEAKLASGR